MGRSLLQRVSWSTLEIVFGDLRLRTSCDGRIPSDSRQVSDVRQILFRNGRTKCGHFLLIEAIVFGTLEGGQTGIDHRPCFNGTLSVVSCDSNLMTKLVKRIHTGDINRIADDHGLQVAKARPIVLIVQCDGSELRDV